MNKFLSPPTAIYRRARIVTNAERTKSGAGAFPTGARDMTTRKRQYKKPTVESLVLSLGFCVGLMLGMLTIMVYMLFLAFGG